MAVKSHHPAALIQTIDEIMRLYKSLPARPSIEEVEAAKSVIDTVNTEEQAKLEEFSRQEPPKDVPEELFNVLQQVRRSMVLFETHQQKKEALFLVEVDKMFDDFDRLIRRASNLVSGERDSQEEKEKEIVSVDDYVDRKEKSELGSDNFKGFIGSSSSKSSFLSGGGESEKMNLMKVAAVIENSAKSESVVLDLRGKLTDRVEWLPSSIGKLSFIAEVDLSENHIMALPSTICSMKVLMKLDLHANQLINLPDEFGELVNLTDLDLHANRLRSLPESFGKLANLMNLDLGSNQFTHLPETIGELTNLKILDVETNDLEELPYTIGNCSSLVELRLDFNQLKALPEAIGKLGCLEIFTLHYNRIKRLPTTMGNLSRLRELDVSFNELETIPEHLCFAVNLKKLNVANNFAALRELPRSIGNLEMLEELDISNDQIRVLPNSFRLLSKLGVFRADENPLEVPSRQVVKLGAQAVVEFMNNLVVKDELKSQPSRKKKKKSCWLRACCLNFWSFQHNSH